LESNDIFDKIQIIFFKAPEARKKVVTAKPVEAPQLEPPPAKGTYLIEISLFFEVSFEPRFILFSIFFFNLLRNIKWRLC